MGQHFVVLWSLQGEAREDPEQDHTFSCVSSFLPVQWGWHLVLGPGFKFLLAASSRVTFLRLCPLFTGGWAHLLLGVAMGKQMSRHLGKYFVKE